MADNESLDRISNELQLQQSKGEAIRGQLQQLQSSILEIVSAVEAINNLKKAKNDALVPVGAGVYLSCPKPSTEKVMVNIGANIMVQKKPEEAVKLLEDRQKKLNDAIGMAQDDMAQVVKTIEDLTARASAMAEEENRNVRPSKE